MTVHSRFMKEIIDEIKSDIVDPVNNAIADAGMEGFDTAVGSTPVDTGRMRSGWRLTKNEKSRSKPKEPLKPIGHVKGSDIFTSELALSRSSAKRVASSFSVKIHNSLYLTNNVSYADIISDRYGILKQAIVAAENKLNSSIRRI